MQHAFRSSALPIALTALLLSGCGSSADDAKHFPGVGMANPNGKGLIVAEGGKSPAKSPGNAQRADIHSFKEFKKLTESCVFLGDYPAILGPWKIAQRGPYAGSIIYPNLYFDGWFVESICLTEVTGTDFRKPLPFIENVTDYKYGVRVTEISYIRPEQDDWFTVRPETDTTP